MTTPSVSILSASPAETRQLAQQVAPLLESGDFVALSGPLGAGKTCFVQALCLALGVREAVRSPTFVLLQQYRVGGVVGVLHHFDLYRLESPEQLDDLGYDDYVYGDGVSVVEWPERAGERLPADRLTLRFDLVPTDPEARHVTLDAHGERSGQILFTLAARLA